MQKVVGRSGTSLAVSTMLKPAERARVDAASRGLYQLVHRDSLDDVLQDVRERRAGAVVFSVARYGILPTSRIATIVREFPQVPAIALLTSTEEHTPLATLSLGHLGVRTLVDARAPGGWSDLREILMAERSGDLEREVLAQLALDLAGATRDCWRFFELLFSASPRVLVVRQLATQLGVLSSTLLSRFFRANLPAPKRYLSLARLIRAAKLFENAGFSVANVANHLEYSSPQSFGRHVRNVMSMSPVQFRERFDSEKMTIFFREELVLPYRDVLRTFSPAIVRPPWIRGPKNFRPRYQVTPRSSGGY
jgi:AraC-like DNA-binding protein